MAYTATSASPPRVKSSVFKMLEYGNQWHHIYDMNHEKWDYNIIGLKNFVYYYIIQLTLFENFNVLYLCIDNNIEFYIERVKFLVASRF